MPASAPALRTVASAPGAIPGIFVIPAIRRLPYAADARLQMLADDLVNDIVDAETRLVRDLDEALLDQGLGEARHDVVPPGNFDRVILERHEVFGGDRDMSRGHRGDGAFGHVD